MYPIGNPSSAAGTSRTAAVADNFAHYLKQAATLLEGLREAVKCDNAPPTIRACMNKCQTLSGEQKAVMYQKMALALADDPCADLGTAQHSLSNPHELNEYYATLAHLAGALKDVSASYQLPGIYGFLMLATSLQSCPYIEQDAGAKRGAVVSMLNWQAEAVSALSLNAPELRPDPQRDADALQPIKLAYGLEEPTKNAAIIVEMLNARNSAMQWQQWQPPGYPLEIGSLSHAAPM